MKTVKNVEFITIVNKSKFITNLFFVTSMESINNHLSIIKNKYKDATHHSYAYIIDNVKRFNDDKEPNGTAGRPILECLEKNDMNYVLAIVTRYFGGIKLGANGLVRAYNASTMNAINNTILLDIIKGFNVILTFDYNDTMVIDKLLSEYKINDKVFDEKVIYNVNIDDDILEKLKSMNISINVKDNIIITKEKN